MNAEEMKAHVLLAKNGNTDSFCKLYELYYKDMYRFAYYMLGNADDAEDVISETVIDAFAGIGRLKKPTSFKSWIFKILSAKCKRQLAVYYTERTRLKHEPDENTLMTEDHPYASNIDVQRAFSTLNETEKNIVSLAVFAGYNSREIAKITDSREGTVRSVKSRAFTKMSKYLKEDFA